jgi:hypothetical protein
VPNRFAGWFQPRRYTLTRFLILRLLGVVYVCAFLGIIFQGPALLGSHGLTPIASYVHGVSFSQLPSIFVWDSSDGMLAACAYLGLAISIAVALGYANLPMLVVLWILYGSYVRVGQIWFAFGWETQLLETTLLAAVLAEPWNPRPLAARPPPVTSIVLMRWLAFRIMLGAGLIKWRGAACWHDLTCLDWHFETQPIPNPLSPWFHHLPHSVHAFGVVFNNVVELVAPWFVFGPRPLRLVAGCLMLAFQVVLVASGNLAFLNWLTIIPVLACFDDDFLRRLLPKRARTWLDARVATGPPRDWHQLVAAIVVGGFVALVAARFTTDALWAVSLLVTLYGVYWAIRFAILHGPKPRIADAHQLLAGVFAGLVAVKSVAVVDNLLARHRRQMMNASFDKLELVNTYGAFGSVGDVRHELVIEGTMAADPTAPDAVWRTYELPCKPGDVARRPCLLGPYHRRLDWLIWFAAMNDEPRDPWLVHLIWKLLDGDPTIRELLDDPFDGTAPAWVRVRRFVYHLEPYDSDTWWTRDSEQLWLAPVSRDTQELRKVIARFGWSAEE